MPPFPQTKLYRNRVFGKIFDEYSHVHWLALQLSRPIRAFGDHPIMTGYETPGPYIVAAITRATPVKFDNKAHTVELR